MRVAALLSFLSVFICEPLLAQSRSGIDFAGEEIKALQRNDAENPGMLWIDRGAGLWGEHCASCHKLESMKSVAARYPKVVDGKIVNLDTQVKHALPRLAYESDELLALTAYVANQSRGMPLNPQTTEKDIAKGRSEYYRRRGQMNLACAHCHEVNAGRKLGAETISQGQPNGYPAYRLEWQKMGSLERRLRACLFGVRAEMPPYGSDELLQLELFLAWRARGLPVETPAVRR